MRPVWYDIILRMLEFAPERIETTTEQRSYVFVIRDAAVTLCVAAGFWCVIVGLATLATHEWHWPLALILGWSVLPLALSGGLRRRA